MKTDSGPATHFSRPNQRLVAQAAAILKKSSYAELRCIDCEAYGDVLTLSGSVPTYFHKQLAQASLMNWLGGNIKIENNLAVTALINKRTTNSYMSKMGHSGTDGDGSPRLRVLIVDDRETDSFLLMQLLQVMGHIVDMAQNGREALEKLDHFAPHLIICDIVMPEMNGYELAYQLRGRAQRPKLVALTGYSEPGDREQAKACGFDEYLVKPVEIKTLQQLLSTVAAEHAAERP
jgi:CheY-like chemotaxis protein